VFGGGVLVLRSSKLS